MIGFGCLMIGTPASANDWQKFYTPIDGFEGLKDADVEPEQLPSKGNFDADIDAMWQRGFAPIGYTYFNASNSKTKDGLRLAKKMKARYVVVGTQYTGTQSASIPISTPTSSTTTNSGNVSVYGSGGTGHGTYSGTSTTYGTQTTYAPISVDRFDKFGIYFKEMPKKGIGVMFRELTPDEVRVLETRRAFVIQSVRDGSPAYNSDMLPGDTILSVNGQPADEANWRSATKTAEAVHLKFLRNGTERQVTIPLPPEWRE